MIRFLAERVLAFSRLNWAWRRLENSYVVVMVTASNRQEAEGIADILLDKRLIVCANIIGPVSSIFLWSGKVERADEYILLMKSRLDHFKELSETVRALHSYEVPEIIALPIVKGSPPYMEWLDISLEPVNR